MEERLEKLRQLAIFTAEDVKELGIHATTLGRWAKSGVIERVERGVFWHPQSSLPMEDLDYAIACKLFGPEAFIGGLSALFHYKLLDRSPGCVWVIVTHEKETTRPKYRLLHSNKDYKLGVEKKPFYRISSLERTLAEALRYSSKIGGDVAVTAAMTAIHRRESTPEKILSLARKLNIGNSVMKHWEALVGAQEVAQSGHT